MKRLVVCLDGTWNRADARGPKTNVVRIRDAVDKGHDRSPFQRLYYDEGVGTGNPLDRIVGGAFGTGLSRNVRQAYKWLSRHYETGDEIYLIGFSRGAYTARSVAGYIGVSGLLRSEECTRAREQSAWDYYRTPKKDRAPGDGLAMKPRCHADVTIRCVAVFDTVGALGIPTEALQWVGREKYDFHDTRLGPSIENAFHALAIDEFRGPFQATLWEKPWNRVLGGQRVEQVWFAGAHSDVGGGYETKGGEPDLASIPLSWMKGRLRTIGLRFTEDDAQPESVDLGKTPRLVHDSRSFPMYALSILRPMYRVIAAARLEPSLGHRVPRTREYEPIGEAVHHTVVDACRVSTYRPRNLEPLADRLGTEELPIVQADGTTMARMSRP